MANMRAGQTLFAGTESITTGGVVSTVLNIGQATNVGIAIQNLGVTNALTVTIEVAAAALITAGVNSEPAAGDATWSTLLKRDGSGPYSISVALSSNAAIDLSPFAFSWIRLRAKSAAATTTCSAQGIING